MRLEAIDRSHDLASQARAGRQDPESRGSCVPRHGQGRRVREMSVGCQRPMVSFGLGVYRRPRAAVGGAARGRSSATQAAPAVTGRGGRSRDPGSCADVGRDPRGCRVRVVRGDEPVSAGGVAGRADVWRGGWLLHGACGSDDSAAHRPGRGRRLGVPGRVDGWCGWRRRADHRNPGGLAWTDLVFERWSRWWGREAPGGECWLDLTASEGGAGAGNAGDGNAGSMCGGGGGGGGGAITTVLQNNGYAVSVEAGGGGGGGGGGGIGGDGGGAGGSGGPPPAGGGQEGSGNGHGYAGLFAANLTSAGIRGKAASNASSGGGGGGGGAEHAHGGTGGWGGGPGAGGGGGGGAGDSYVAPWISNVDVSKGVSGAQGFVTMIHAAHTTHSSAAHGARGPDRA
jgi:hypothetical protein